MGTYGAHIFLICLSLLPFLVCHDHPNAQGFKHRVIAIGSYWDGRRKKILLGRRCRAVWDSAGPHRDLLGTGDRENREKPAV